MAEKIIYQNGDVSISNSKAVFGGNSYFMKNIASIRVVGASSGLAWLLAIIGGIMGLAALNDLKHGGWLLGLIGAGLIYVAYKYVGFARWIVHFDTSSGSVTAYKSKNKQLIFEIKAKIEEAMTVTE